MKTTFFQPVAEAKPAGEPVSPLVPVPYYFLIGAGVGACVSVGLGVWLVRVLVWWQALGWSLSVGLFVGSMLGVILSLWGVTQEWVMRWADWLRGRNWAKKDRQRALDEAEQKFVTVELPTGERLFFIGLEVLMREWLDGKGSNRDDMVAAGVCSQAEWGMLNALFLYLRLKVGHKFMKLEGDEPADGRFTFDAAVSLYRSMVAVVPPDERRDDPGGLWVAGHGRWMKENVQPKKRGKK